MFDFLEKISGLLHAAPLTLEDNFNADILWHLDAHELTKCTLISIDIDKAFVNTHLPAIPCGSPLPIRALADRYN
jgi:hypothetical protein